MLLYYLVMVAVRGKLGVWQREQRRWSRWETMKAVSRISAMEAKRAVNAAGGIQQDIERVMGGNPW